MRLRSLVRPVLALAAALPLGLAGCTILQPIGHISGDIPAPQPSPTSNSKFWVGAARVDLTPIPGIPMNYSLEGKLSRGFWTRLYARAVYVQDENRNAIVLVSCDLPHIPNGLGDRVAEIVSTKSKIDHLGRGQIVLAATHTHNGPENFFSDAFYNSFPSARAGFDPQLVEFLAQQAASAIGDAFENRQESVEVRYRQAKLPGFFRNRSLDAFLRNADENAFLAGNALVPDNCLLAEGDRDPRACRAVRSQVEVVEFIGANGKPIASTVFLAAHPTVLSSATEVYSGDLFEATATLLEQQRLGDCAGYAPPVVALFNGAQGDASVTWNRRDRFELLNADPTLPTTQPRLGLAVQLARFICGKDPGIQPTSDQHLDASDPERNIAFQFAWLSLKPSLHSQTLDPNDCMPWNEHCTVQEPLPGLATMGGAQDGRTFWYELGLKQGLVSASRGTHGRKVVGLEAGGISIELSKLVTDPGPPPDTVPVGVYRIGSLVIAALPGEFTSVMGERIRQALDKAAGPAAPVPGARQRHVVLIGLANGHVSYVTTPEEYDAQFYEGASNLYGAATGPLIEAKLVELTGKTGSSPADARPYEYEPGACRVFLPRDAGAPSFDSADGLQNILLDLSDPDATKRDFQKQCWIDAIPKLPHSSNACVRSVPYVWVEKKNTANPGAQCTQLFGTQFLERPCDKPHPSPCNPLADPRTCIAGIPQDNCGLDVVTVLHGSYRDRTRWCAFWMPSGTPAPGDYSICVAGVTGENVSQAGGYVGDEDLGLSIDTGADGGLVGKLITEHLECCGVSTRPVCDFPPP